MKQFGTLPRTANSIAPAIIAAGIAAAGSIAGGLASRHGGGGGSASESTSRTPAAWEPDMKQIWDDYMKSRASGTREALAQKYSSVLGGLMGQYMKPAYGIKIGGQTVPVIPRRNLLALGTAANALAEQYGMEMEPIKNDQDLAMMMQNLRYGNSGSSNIGDMSRTPSVLESIGVGTDLFGSIYPAVKGMTTTPTTAQVASNPYSQHYSGQPLIGPNGRVAAM